MLGSFASFGFAGQRSGVGVVPARVLGAALPAGAGVFATCGRGVPSVGRALPGAVVFSVRAAAFAALPVRVRFARRASVFVAALAAAPSPLLLCWPGVAAPSGLSWSRRSWQSCGSGSWSEVALAVGLGVPAVVFGVGRPSLSARPVVVSGFSGWLVSPVQKSLF